jgi:hypothetical protein
MQILIKSHHRKLINNKEILKLSLTLIKSSINSKITQLKLKKIKLQSSQGARQQEKILLMSPIKFIKTR